MNSRVFATCLVAVQSGRCFYCDTILDGPTTKRPRANQWTRDHVVPQRAGGKNFRNVVLACHRCNSDKGHRAPTVAERARAAEAYDRALVIYAAFLGATVTEAALKHMPDLPRLHPITETVARVSAEEFVKGAAE